MFRKLFTRTAVAAVLGAGAVLGAAAPAFAANPTTTSADIGAGSAGTRIGNSTFTRTLLANGDTQISITSVFDDSGTRVKESQLCYQTSGPYTSRVSSGQCELQQRGSADYTFTIPASAGMTAQTIYFQLHIDVGDTAFAGWTKSGNEWFGNVAVEPAEAGTSVPVGTVGGIGLAAALGLGLVLAVRRRSGATVGA